MSATWRSDDTPRRAPIGPAGWIRVGLRAGALGAVVFGGLGVLLFVRLVERPLFGLKRPVTPYITQAVCRSALLIMGLRYRTEGQLMRRPGAVVANHSSWIDIFALNARKRIYFVSKSEVASWPGIGWLARATGTVFINRDAREARAQTQIFEDRLVAGHKLLFFPEGTSTDGMRVLPFKATLFAAFFMPELREICCIQPATVIYRAPPGADPRFYGWWGDMDFGSHLLQVLSARRQGSVTLVYHAPLTVAEHRDRKSLALACEEAVRRAMPQELAAFPVD